MNRLAIRKTNFTKNEKCWNLGDTFFVICTIQYCSAGSSAWPISCFSTCQWIIGRIGDNRLSSWSCIRLCGSIVIQMWRSYCDTQSLQLYLCLPCYSTAIWNPAGSLLLIQELWIATHRRTVRLGEDKGQVWFYTMNLSLQFATAGGVISGQERCFARFRDGCSRCCSGFTRRVGGFCFVVVVFVI